MKKHPFILLLGVIACLFIGCNNSCDHHGGHPDLLASNPDGGYIHFFQFTDTAYMNNILVAPGMADFDYMFH